MEGPRSSRRASKKVLASVAVIAGVSVFVSFGVFSAFTATKTNNSTLKSATLTLTGSSALISLEDLVPGDSLLRCIRVANTGNVSGTLELKATAPAANALSNFATVQIREVTGLPNNFTDGTCPGEGVVDGSTILGTSSPVALSSITATPADLGTIAPGNGGAKGFKVSVNFPLASSTNLMQNLSADLGLEFTATQLTGAAR
jgi:hypothetical protein